MDHLFLGQIVHCKSFDELETIVDGYVAVKNGKIIGVGERDSLAVEYLNALPITQLTPTQFLLPGFVDCHIHAPQYPNVGLGLDLPLLDWLNTYTFPLESQYQNVDFALKVYAAVVRRTLASGTTLATYFATNHKESSVILAKEAVRQGQRALVGKVSSDCCCPDYYVETTATSLKDNVQFIEDVLKLNSNLVRPIVTPRFALSCGFELQKGLSELARKYDLHIQSHISENVNEIEAVKGIFKSDNYASVYESTNILTNKCILAHGVHLEDAELEILKKYGTSIAHCPTSNTNLRSGFCDVRRIIEAGIKVGLGTDVSGGSSPSILTTIKDTLDVSLNLSFVKKQHVVGTGRISNPEHVKNANYVPLNYKQALFLATLGGAEALALDDNLGNFIIGKDFDCLLVDVARHPIDCFELPEVVTVTPNDKLLQLLQKFLYAGDDRNIINVFVAGRCVKNIGE